MGMTRKLWSLNGLATELDYDRRTVAATLKKIRPDGRLNGNPAWFLDTALNVLKVKPKKVAERFDPKWPAAYKTNCDKVEDFPQGCTVLGAMVIVYRAPAVAAVMTVRNGMDPAAAYRLRWDLAVALMGTAEEELKSLNVKPFSDGEKTDWVLSEFDEPNWQFLSEMAGVPCDVEGWHAAMIERNKAEGSRA